MLELTSIVGCKQMFMVGIYFLLQSMESFGIRLILSECLWACSYFHVPPPADVIKSLGQVNVGVGSEWGYLEPDPVDLINSVVGITAGPSTPKEDILKKFDLTTEREILEVYNAVSSSIPVIDFTVLAALLSRPSDIGDGNNRTTLELTPSRFTQAVYFWRRIAHTIVTIQLDSPGSDYARIEDIIKSHVIDKEGKRRIGHASVSCLSPFETVSLIIDWLTSIKTCPISVIQALALVAREGACDPWLEDPHQHNRGERTHSLTHSLTRSLTHSLAHSLTHSLTQVSASCTK